MRRHQIFLNVFEHSHVFQESMISDFGKTALYGCLYIGVDCLLRFGFSIVLWKHIRIIERWKNENNLRLENLSVLIFLALLGGLMIPLLPGEKSGPKLRSGCYHQSMVGCYSFSLHKKNKL